MNEKASSDEPQPSQDLRRTPVTVADVAKRAGVHPSTVSRALTKGTSRVSDALVKRVSLAAEELNYRPNGVAKALRISKSASVGMVIPDISNPVYSPMVRGVEDALRPAGLSVLVASTDNDISREEAILETMLDRKIDGLLLATVTRKYQYADRLLRSRIPVVLIGRASDMQWASSVRADDSAGITLAVEHLIKRGHRRLVHLAGTESVSIGRNRRKAFLDAIAEGGLSLSECSVLSADEFGGPMSVNLGAMMASELLRRGVKFTGVVAANDLLSIGCYEVFYAKGISIPSDVSIIGYNDIFLVDHMSPPLTTIRVPFHDLGIQGGRLLLQKMSGEGSAVSSISLRPELVIRNSTSEVVMP